MTEILFRGKRLDNGEWVSGNLFVSDTDGRTYILAGSRMITIEWEVDPSTVCQYTSLTDKNGKRIFEGDIVQYHERQFDGKDVPVRDAVIYEEGGFSVRAYFLNNWLWNSINGNTQLRDVEIIGNIHDKPELLKEGADNG